MEEIDQTWDVGLQCFEEVDQVLVPGLAVMHHEMAHQCQHHHHDGQLLLPRKLNVLQLAVCIIRNEHQRIFKVFDQQVIELA